MIVVVAVTWWIVLLAGLMPSAWFLIRFRPAQWREAPAVIMRGLVAVAFLAYLRPVVSLILAGGTPVFRGGDFQVVWAYALLIATDGLLLYLLRVFLRYRRAYTEEFNKPNGAG